MQRQEVIELVPFKHQSNDGKLHLRSKCSKFSFGIDFKNRFEPCEVYSGIIVPDFQPKLGCTRWFYHREVPKHEIIRRYLATSNKRTWRLECNKLRVRSERDEY